MIKTDVSSLDTTIHKANAWLRELTDIGGYVEPAQAYTALRAVLHTLRDLLGVDESAQLAANMPMIIRGLFFEGWKPSKVPVPMRTREDFMDHIRRQMGNADIEPEQATGSVFRLLDRKIAEGEIDDIRSRMHQRIRELWPTPPSLG